jgi:hypothetical protein
MNKQKKEMNLGGVAGQDSSCALVIFKNKEYFQRSGGP